MNHWKPFEITEQNYWHDAMDHVGDHLLQLAQMNIICCHHIEERGENWLYLFKYFERYLRYLFRILYNLDCFSDHKHNQILGDVAYN
jgi:hypothetical protein